MTEYLSDMSPDLDYDSGGGIWRCLTFSSVKIGSVASSSNVLVFQVPSYSKGIRIHAIKMRCLTSGVPATLATYSLGTLTYGSYGESLVTTICSVTADDSTVGNGSSTAETFSVGNATTPIEVAAGGYIALQEASTTGVASDCEAEVQIWYTDR